MNFKEFIEHPLQEGNTSSRYSVDVNFRTKAKEVMENFAKITLAYVSAGLKQAGYHTKHVYEEKPLRLLVSSRNWDDGEWVGLVTFSLENGGCFYVSKGFFNKDRKTVSIQSSHKCNGDSAADITREMRNLMQSVKGEKDRHVEKLKGIPLKRGPKR